MAIAYTPVFRWLVPAQTGTGGGLVPAAGYKAKYYKAGLPPSVATEETIYTDPALSVPYPSPSNTAVLNSDGYAVIYLDPSKTYKVLVTRPDDSVYATIDGVQGAGAIGTASADSFEALKDVDPSQASLCFITGYYSPGDGGHGMFYVDLAVAPDGGYVQSSNVDPTKSWFRVPDEDGSVRAASFGFSQSVGTIQTSQMQAADSYAASTGRPLLIDVGNGTAQIGAMTFNAPRVIFTGRGLKGIASVPAVIFNSLVEGPPAFLFERMTVTLSNADQVAYPEWWNTTKDGATDDLAKINAMFASGAEEFVFADGDYEVSAPPTFPATGLIKSYGTVTEGATVHVAPGLRQIDAGGILRAESLTADAGITAGTNIKAGQTAAVAGLLSQRIGTGSTSDSPAVSTQSTQVSSASTSGTGEDPLLTKDLEANSLTADGDGVRIAAGGTFSGTMGTNSTFSIRLKIGGTLFVDLVIKSSSSGTYISPTRWHSEIRLLKQSGNVRGSGLLVSNGTVGTVPSDDALFSTADYNSIAKDLTALQALAFFGESSDGGLTATQNYMAVEYIKAR